MTDKTKEMAIALIDTIQKREAEYVKINRALSELQGDFSVHLELMDTDVGQQLVSLLDQILGDEVASYYLYECVSMKDGGTIWEKEKGSCGDGTPYRLKDIEDLKKYVFREKK